MLEPGIVVSAMLNGLVNGMVLILVAAGLSLIFGLMRVVNFAHGSFYMIGAYTAALTAPTIGSYLALALAIVVTGVIGMVLEFVSLRPLYDRDPLLQLLATFALALMIREGIKYIYGTGSLSMNAPTGLRGSVQLGAFSYSAYNLLLVLVGAVVIVAVDLTLRETNVGSIIRGAAHDDGMIRILGIDIDRYWTVVFGVGTALAGLAGALVGPIRDINPAMDFTILLPAFVVVILGGLGSFRGSVLSGLLLGQVMSFTTLYWSQGSEIIAFVLLIVALLVRPEGLLGEPEMIQ
jgi:branched-chain amino acid transport system permease protein